MQASSPKPSMSSMRNTDMFATVIMAERINSLVCQKLTSSIPGCCEEERKPIIIRNDGGNPRISPWLPVVGIKPFIFLRAM